MFHVPNIAQTNARVIGSSDWPESSKGNLPGDRTITIETIALDDLQLDGISFIKVDIEGAEEKFWQGSQQFLDRNPNVILLLEFNAVKLHAPETTLKDMEQSFTLRYLDD